MSFGLFTEFWRFQLQPVITNTASEPVDLSEIEVFVPWSAEYIQGGQIITPSTGFSYQVRGVGG